MLLFLYLLASAGFMSLVKYKLPYKEKAPRIIFDGLHCSLCLGFWAGIVLVTVDFFLSNQLLWYLPFATSAFCWFFDSLIDLIQVTAEKNDQITTQGTNKK